MNTSSKDKQTQQQTPIPNEIRIFLEGLLDDADIHAVDDQVRETMLQDLFVRLDAYIAASLVDMLPKENFDEFIKMNKENKPQQEIEVFLKEKIPDFAQKMTVVFGNFREMYLGNMVTKKDT